MSTSSHPPGLTGSPAGRQPDPGLRPTPLPSLPPPEPRASGLQPPAPEALPIALSLAVTMLRRATWLAWLAATLLLGLFVATAIVQLTLNRTLTETRARLEQTEARLQEAELSLSESVAVRHAETLRRRSTDELLMERLSELRAAQAALEHLDDRLRSELGALQQHTRAELEQLSARTQDLAARAPAPLHTLFSGARKAVLFIRTEYEVELHREGRQETFSAFGTGFLVSADGLAVTAQHVLYPWKFDKQLQMLVHLGRMQVLERTVRHTVWVADQPVMSSGDPDAEVLTADTFRAAPGRHNLRVLYRAPLKLADELVNTPFGQIPLEMPVLGHTDIAAFQLIDPARSFAHLPLPRTGAPQPQALDEVLLVGYPLSRLHDGVAAPQPMQGRVRRLSLDVLELDSPVQEGLSGGPVLNAQGQVIGMASAMLDAPIYGIAVRAENLQQAYDAARRAIAREQQALRKLGCYSGAVDGIHGPDTDAAHACALERDALY